MENLRVYPYRPRQSVLRRFWLTAAAAIFMAVMALTNDRGRGLVLYCLPMSKPTATIFYACLAGIFGVAATVMGIRYQLHSKAKRRVVLTESEITIPRGARSEEEVVVPFQQISRVVVQEEMKYARIEYGGCQFTLALDYLEPNQFLEIVDCLAKHCPIAKE
jgi:hypothetical protein